MLSLGRMNALRLLIIIVALYGCLISLMCSHIEDPPINSFTGERFETTYVQEWRQAVSTRGHADVPFSKTDQYIVGHWACDTLGNLGMMYEYVGRDQTAKTVEFTGTAQSEGLRQRLDKISKDIQELMDYIEFMGK